MKVIRAIYYAAIAEQIIPADKNPFFIYKLKADNKAKKDKLTVEEIITIEGLKFDEGSVIWHVRNFFLFSFYCAGIRASDVLQLKWQNVSPDGRLEYHMEKTGQYKSISLMPKANAILKHYKNRASKPQDYIFPFIDKSLDLKDSMVLFNQISSCTALVNKYLKEVATKADIKKVLSTHIARHSFADIARTKKASVYDISKMLGHSSIKITEAYLASLDIDSQDETMKSVLDY
jgi:integrase